MPTARVYNAHHAQPRDGARDSLQRDTRANVTRNKTLRTAEGSAAARLLASYRRRLQELLGRAELASPAEPAELRLAVGELVEDLNADLLRLYRLAESGALPRGAGQRVLRRPGQLEAGIDLVGRPAGKASSGWSSGRLPTARARSRCGSGSCQPPMTTR